MSSPPNTIFSLFASIIYILIVISLVAIIVLIFLKIKKTRDNLKNKIENENEINNLPNVIVTKNDILSKQTDLNKITGAYDLTNQFVKINSSNLNNKYTLDTTMKYNIETDNIIVNGNSFGKDYIDYNITNTCNLEVSDVLAFNSFKIDNNSVIYSNSNLLFDSAFDTKGDLLNTNHNFNVSDVHAQNINFNDMYNISNKVLTMPSSNSISIFNEGTDIHSFNGLGDVNHSGDVNIKNCVYFKDDIMDPDSFEKNRICENGLFDNIDKKVTFQNDLVDVNGDMNTCNVNILNNTVYSDNSSNMYVMNSKGEKFTISLNKWG